MTLFGFGKLSANDFQPAIGIPKPSAPCPSSALMGHLCAPIEDTGTCSVPPIKIRHNEPADEALPASMPPGPVLTLFTDPQLCVDQNEHTVVNKIAPTCDAGVDPLCPTHFLVQTIYEGIVGSLVRARLMVPAGSDPPPVLSMIPNNADPNVPIEESAAPTLIDTDVYEYAFSGVETFSGSEWFVIPAPQNDGGRNISVVTDVSSPDGEDLWAWSPLFGSWSIHQADFGLWLFCVDGVAE